MTGFEAHRQLVAGLVRVLGHAGEPVVVVETHISTVLLAGPRAYKLRKPVALGFLDFTTLTARQHDCEEELRLNRRTAPALYVGVVAISGTPASPELCAQADAPAEVLDYALVMQRFDVEQVLDRLAARGVLGIDLMAPLAQAVARLHRDARVAPDDHEFGTPSTIAHWVDSNIEDLRQHAMSPRDRERLDALAGWSRQSLHQLRPLMQVRRAAGRVRECHGDLHLANVVLLNGQPVPFDALEFSAALRFIDVINDIAFLWMDLQDHGLPRHAARVLDAWLAHSGDYDGLPLLRYYAVYRALVRAKVAQIRARQPALPPPGRVREHTSFEHYLTLAERLRQGPAPLLVVMTGLSGSGKSTVASRLAERLAGLRVRSDVERKRLYGVAPGQPGNPQLYSAEATARTYARLVEVAHAALGGGITVVVDAASLKVAERRDLLAVADAHGVTGAIVECSAPLELLRARVQARAQRRDDPSDATVEVLQAQLQWREPFAPDELARVHYIDTSGSTVTLDADCDELATLLLEDSLH